MITRSKSSGRLAGAAAILALGFGAMPAQAGDLYFDYTQNYSTNSGLSSLFLFGAAGQQATVTTLSGYSNTVTLGADGFFNLPIPDSFEQVTTGIQNKGFKVSSVQDIAGYFVNREPATTDMTYILDSGALGTDYVVASHAGGAGAQAVVHATVDGTQVTITPKGAAAFTVTLNAGESYSYKAPSTLTDLSGSTVSATAPVAVFGGNACTNVGGVSYCDMLVEQMIPNNKLSTQYYVTASQGASISPTQSDLVRIIATQPGTQVTLNGSVVATLGAGDFYDFDLGQGAGAKIDSTAPVMVSQYLKGGNGLNTDPAMSLVPGADTWLSAYRLATPTGTQQFNVNYASIVIPTAILASLQLNGAAVDTSGFVAIAGTTFSRGIVSLPLGLFDLTASDKFLVMLGGGSAADSYFTYGGATFARGISPPDDEEPPVDGVPEPSTLVLLGLGLLGATMTRRRRRS